MKYRLRFFFDPGSSICFWSGDDATQEKFNYPVEAKALGLSENLCRQVAELCTRFDTSINWDHPSDLSPWSDAERAQFYAQAQDFLTKCRAEIGDRFDIIDESTSH